MYINYTRHLFVSKAMKQGVTTDFYAISGKLWEMLGILGLLQTLINKTFIIS